MEYDQNGMQVIVTGKKLCGVGVGGRRVVKLCESKAMMSSGKFLKKSQKDKLFTHHSIKYMDSSSGGLELEMDQWDI